MTVSARCAREIVVNGRTKQRGEPDLLERRVCKMAQALKERRANLACQKEKGGLGATK